MRRGFRLGSVRGVDVVADLSLLVIAGLLTWSLYVDLTRAFPGRSPDGVFFAEGIYGQYIYVDRPRGVVVAITSADRSFRAPGAKDDALEMFGRLARLASGGG